jgi:hypothetical protein
MSDDDCSTDELRRWPRFLFGGIDIALQPEKKRTQLFNSYHDCALVDISASGLGVYSEHPYDLEQRLTVWFQRESDDPQSLQAVVVHVAEAELDPPWRYRIGLEYLYLRERRMVDHPLSVEFLRELLARLERERDALYDDD